MYDGAKTARSIKRRRRCAEKTIFHRRNFSNDRNRGREIDFLIRANFGAHARGNGIARITAGTGNDFRYFGCSRSIDYQSLKCQLK